MKEIAKFWIPNRVVPKQRPRVTSNGTYYSQNYTEWMEFAIAEISCQKHIFDYQTPQFSVKVESQFINFRLGDCDNLEGACLDAMVKAEYLTNDSARYVVDNRGFFSTLKKRKKKPKIIGCIIKVFEHSEPIQVNQADQEFILKLDNRYT